MSVAHQGNQLTYSSKRLWPKPAGAHSQIEIELAAGNADSQPTVATHAAQPGTLEFFLVERYVMYMQRADGRLRGGRVWHEPYPVQEPRLLKCEESLLAGLGIRTEATPCHVAYSPGVQVEIFAPYDLDE
jgi:uncharacterized protein YqjF (DUF2071 family)